ncbi:transposase [Oxalobacteraceae bacterium OTU3CAMAD1]|nr:transposase [Oxalobacteraceae bacterium OTU3CAMAD1]
MARPLRLEFPGALYHVTCRGNRRERVFCDRQDRLVWLEETARMCDRFHFVIHAYCQMTNHYHLLIETPDGNLGQGMRQLNSVYSRYYNRRHDLVGHVLQGRYHAILVQKESYLLELARYIVLNPIRAGIVDKLGDWEWSSLQFMLGDRPSPSWMNTKWLLDSFGEDPVSARQAYLAFLLSGIDAESPLEQVAFRCILGDDEFIAQHRKSATTEMSGEIAREQRRATALPLEGYAAKFSPREIAMAEAYHSTVYTMSQIAAYFQVSVKTVSRAIAALERADRAAPKR